MKKKTIKKQINQHDRFFKGFYSEPQFALKIFQLLFSKKEFQAYNWKKLKTEKESFKDKIADLVFSVPLKGTPKLKLKIFILLEHKSYYDPKVFSQLLIYQSLIHEQNLKEGNEAMPIIPILFYHGEKPWRGAKSFQEGLFGKSFSKIPIESRKNMLNYRIKILDSHSLKVRRLFKDKKIEAYEPLYLLDRIWSLDVGSQSELKDILSLFSRFSGKRDDLMLNVLEYLRARGVKKALWERVERELVGEGLFQKGGYMDIRKQILWEGIQKGKQEGLQQGIQKGKQEGLQQGIQKGKQEGLQQGIQKGKQEGLQEGLQEGQQKFVLYLLKEKKDIPFIVRVTGLSEKEIKKLKNGSK